VGRDEEKEVNPRFECAATASLLDSGASLAAASHCAAVIGAAGILLAHSAAARVILIVPVLFWPAACYFSFRVAIDASLFRELAMDDQDNGPALDDLLRRRGLARGRPGRTLSDRSDGAVKLWRRLTAITAIQVATAVAAILVEVWAR
jgi:hypothetical protein